MHLDGLWYHAQDARDHHSFRPFGRHRRPASPAGRSPFRRGRVDFSQASTPDAQSRPQAFAQFTRHRSNRRRFLRPFHAPGSPPAFRHHPETVNSTPSSERSKETKVSYVVLRYLRRRPGPKGPKKELIAAVVEMKRRNPNWGCPRIAQQITLAFGVDIDKDMFRRILSVHYPGPTLWFESILAHLSRPYKGQLVELRFVPMRVCNTENTLGSRGDGPIYTAVDRVWRPRRHCRRSSACRMFSRAIGRQSLPKYLSSDNDPLYRFHQWQANLRVLEVTEIKTPYVPLSHPFVERLIGTIRREYLDRMLFWTTVDLEEKLLDFQRYYNAHRAHAGLRGRPPEPGIGKSPIDLGLYRWQKHCRGLYQLPVAA